MKTFGCVNNTIRTWTGIYFDLANPKPEEVRLKDIAQGLSNICRFGGQINRFYSVAEHCVLAAMEAEKRGFSKRIIKAVLLHDAAEAYVGDVVKPLKIMLPQFAEIESAVESAIEQRYGVDLSHAAIKPIDHAMLIAERHQLFSADDVKWVGEDEAERISVKCRCLTPADAYVAFMGMTDHLGMYPGE